MIVVRLKSILLACLIFAVSACSDSCAAMGTSAQAAILIETSTNTVLYEKNPHQKLPMASTTKIMTALCAIEAGNIDRTIVVDDSAVGVEGSSIYLEKGERITLRELIYGLMLHSGNDAAVAIACAVSGSVQEFAQLMNDTAQRIGAVNTHFDNPNGLDSESHYTTAYDLAIITSYALKNKYFADVVSTYTASISNGSKDYKRQLKNHNKLLKLYDGCTGVKTGYTRRCGRCLVSSAKRDTRELVAVTLNDGNDWQDHINMLDYGFANTVSKRVIKKGEYIQRIPVNGGNGRYVNAVADADLYVTLPAGTEGKVQITADVYGAMEAPVSYGTVAGAVNVTVDGKPLPKIAAVCDRSVPKEEKNTFVKNLNVLIKVWQHVILILQIY